VKSRATSLKVFLGLLEAEVLGWEREDGGARSSTENSRNPSSTSMQ